MPRVYDPVSGKTRTIAAADVEAALDEGLELETAGSAKRREYEKTAGAGEALKATGEGLLGGATLGLSDVALAAAGGDEYRENRKLRDETFGGLHTAAEVIGGVAPVLLSGGSGLAAKAAAMSPAAIAARAAATAERGVAAIGGRALEGSLLKETVGGALRFGAAGAAEGAVAGAGFALSEAALADEAGGFDSLAERAWAGAKQGAIFGLVGGAAIGGLGGAAIGSTKRLAQRFAGAGDELAEAANERAFKVMSPRYNDARKLGSAKIQQIGEDIRNYNLRDGRSLLDAFDNTESFAPKMSAARREVTEELGALRAKAAADPTPVDAKEFLRRVDNEVLDPLRTNESPEIRRIASRVDRNLEQLRADVAAGAPVTYSRLLKLQKQSLAPIINPKLPKGGVAVARPGTDELQRVERILDETLGGHVEETLGKIAQATDAAKAGLGPMPPVTGSIDDVARYQEVKRLSESFIKADELMKKTAPQNAGNRFISPSDYATGLGAGMALFDGGASAVAGLGVAMAHKQIRERGSAMLATLYTRSRQMEGAMESKLGAFFKKARSDAKRTGIAAGGIAAGETVGFDVRRALAARDGEKTEDAYDRVVARAHDITSGRAVGPYVLDDHAPKTAHAMRQTQMRAAAHLVKHAPVPPMRSKNPNLGALNAQTRPNPVQMYDFARRVRAIERPETILDDLNNGTLSMAAIEAVRDVHPQSYAWMRARVMDGLGDSTELLPYQHRIRLGIQFELPTDPSLRPENLAATQAIYAVQRQAVTSKPMPAGSSPRSKRILSMSEELETGESI